jgi:ureidoglycolate lyase
MLPLDGDVLIHVAPAGSQNMVPYDEFEIFRIPMGTVVALRPGVWHHGPFCVDKKPVNNLILLPERTYANDCVQCMFPEEVKLRIE